MGRMAQDGRIMSFLIIEVPSFNLIHNSSQTSNKIPIYIFLESHIIS